MAFYFERFNWMNKIQNWIYVVSILICSDWVNQLLSLFFLTIKFALNQQESFEWWGCMENYETVTIWLKVDSYIFPQVCQLWYCYRYPATAKRRKWFGLKTKWGLQRYEWKTNILGVEWNEIRRKSNEASWKGSADIPHYTNAEIHLKNILLALDRKNNVKSHLEFKNFMEMRKGYLWNANNVR